MLIAALRHELFLYARSVRHGFRTPDFLSIADVPQHLIYLAELRLRREFQGTLILVLPVYPLQPRRKRERQIMQCTLDVLHDAIRPSLVLKYPLPPRFQALVRALAVRFLRHTFAARVYMLGTPGPLYSRVIRRRDIPEVVWIEDGARSFTPNEFVGRIKNGSVYRLLTSLLAGPEQQFTSVFFSAYDEVTSLGERLPLRFGQLREYLREKSLERGRTAHGGGRLLVGTQIMSLDQQTQLELLTDTVDRLNITTYFPHRYHDVRVTRELASRTGVAIGQGALPIELIAMMAGNETHFVLMPGSTWRTFSRMKADGVPVSFTQLHIGHWLSKVATGAQQNRAGLRDFIQTISRVESFLGDVTCIQVSLLGADTLKINTYSKSAKNAVPLDD